VAESRRLLGVLEQRLKGREWVLGPTYSVVDIAIFPWINNLINNYGAAELVGIQDFPEVARVLQAFLARPAVARGMKVLRG
jgi:GST-like protein